MYYQPHHQLPTFKGIVEAAENNSTNLQQQQHQRQSPFYTHQTPHDAQASQSHQLGQDNLQPSLTSSSPASSHNSYQTGLNAQTSSLFDTSQSPSSGVGIFVSFKVQQQLSSFLFCVFPEFACGGWSSSPSSRVFVFFPLKPNLKFKPLTPSHFT